MKKTRIILSAVTLFAGIFTLTSCGNKKPSTSTTTVPVPTETVTTPTTTPTETITTTPTETTTNPTPTETTTPSDLPSSYTGYYSNMTGNLGSTFRSTLNSIISSDLKSSSYANAWTILQEADEDPTNSNNILCFYTGRSIPKSDRSGSGSGSVNWNREHVWAKSHGFGNSTSVYAYYDAYHLHATEEKINNSRGNMPFDNVTGGSSDSYGNSWTSQAFEPRDEVKGDVARSMFYMVVRYESSSLDLELEDILTSTSSKDPKLGKLSTLLEWAYNDPVSEEELKRNEVVAKYQGNRNPFIDNPEFAYYLYPTESNKLGVTLDNLADKINNGSTVIPTPTPDPTPIQGTIESVLAGTLGQTYTVTGVIDNVANTTYGNLTIKDSTGSLFVYGLYSADGSIRYDAMTTKPVAGDTVTITGELAEYNSTFQLKNAKLITLTPGTTPASNPDPTPDDATATITFADITDRTSVSDQSQVWTKNGITVTNNKSASITAVNATYTDPIRCYKSSDIVIEYTEAVTKIVLTTVDTSYGSYSFPADLAIAGATVVVNGTTTTITFETPTTTLTISNLANQIRLASVAVYTN